MPAPQEMTLPQLLRQIGTPGAPLIIDVTTDEDFALAPRIIPGAIRLCHTNLPALLTSVHSALRDRGPRPVLVTCQKGKKLSQGVAAWLASQQINAEYLSGGMMAWHDNGAPSIPQAALPQGATGAEAPGSLWVTRHRPKIDRIACPWLIRRFVDPKARFLFVAPAEVAGVAEKFDAIPFDVLGVAFSHREDGCSFDTLLEHYDLHLPALDRLAKVIRAADTNRHDLAPEAAGLLALSVGVSRLYRDDQDQLAAGLPLYDALFRWARDGQDETHDWPGHCR